MLNHGDLRRSHDSKREYCGLLREAHWRCRLRRECQACPTKGNELRKATFPAPVVAFFHFRHYPIAATQIW
jgi:hypothetical protein